MAAKETVGVEAAVTGLLSFMGDMKKMDKSIKDIGDSGTLLQRVFSGLGSVISGLVSGAFRILEVALGVLLRDAIRFVIDQFRELITTAIETTTEFQKLEVRLNRFNLKNLTQEEKDLGLGMEYVNQQTQEQLKWIIELGANTPFDSSDIGNVYSLARSYGFADQEAKDLTTQITDFASGMGLSNEVIERIIQNFGQMKQAGKITGTEIRDLARGAFVPVNDILDRVAVNLGITQEQLSKLRKQGLTDAEMFFVAFGQMAGEDFAGATQDMNKVFAVSIENIKEMARSLLAFNVIKPIFEGLAGIFVKFQEAISVRFDSFWAITQRIGQTIKEIIDEIVGGLPGVDTLADGILTALESVSGWLIQHKGDIVDFVQGALAELGKLSAWAFGTTEKEGPVRHRGGQELDADITPGTSGAIAGLVANLVKLSDWVTTNKPLITDFFKALGEILSTVAKSFAPPGGGEGGGGGGFLASVTKFMQFVVDNKEGIAKWAEILFKAFLIFQLLTTALAFAVSIIVGIAGAVATLVLWWNTLQAVLWVVKLAFGVVLAILGLITLPIWALIAAIVILAVIFMANKDRLKEIWEQLLFIFSYYSERIRVKIQEFLTNTINKFTTWGSDVKKKLTDTINDSAALPWFRIGAAIILGVVNYVQNHIGVLASIIAGAVQSALDAIGGLFDDGVDHIIGHSLPPGFIKDAESAAEDISQVMASAVATGIAAGMTTPSIAMGRSMPSSVNTTYQNQNNFNLAIHSNTKSESLMQDFSMLRSLMGL